MEEHRHILPSNFSSQHLETSKPRLPLTGSSGNAQYHTVGSTSLWSEHKGQNRVQYPLPTFTLPTLPSSHPGPLPLRSASGLGRQHSRAPRDLRHHRNPIVDSENYRNYRGRQVKEKGEQKWPDHLEELFLDAYLDVPQMGRKKYSFGGRQWGRNELISLYIEIGTRGPPNLPLDPTFEFLRGRKQVSSHIQVLKQFFRGHPDFYTLFPEEKKGTFEPAYFKNSPCLIALSRLHLPHKRPNPTNYLQKTPQQRAPPTLCSVTPCLFKLWMTLDPKIKLEDGSEEKYSGPRHTYSDSTPKALAQENLERLPDWRSRFPALAKLGEAPSLRCDIIHMEVSLELRLGRAPPGANLMGEFCISVPGKHDGRMRWRCTQTLSKPEELYGPTKIDRRDEIDTELRFQKFDPGAGTTQFRVHFPATSWTYILYNLSSMNEQFDAALPSQPTQSARQFIDQISMEQVFWSREIEEGNPQARPWTRQAVILWTFRKCSSSEIGTTTWRSLNQSPSRSTVFSPHPGPAHDATAVMVENFNCWTEPQPLLQPSTGFDHIMHDLTTPSTMMPSPFQSYGYANTQHDLATESLSFMSQETQDSDSTLVEQGTDSQMDSFLSTADVALGDYDHSHSIWAGTTSDGFDTDTTYLAPYNGVASSGSQIWDGDAKEHQVWEDSDAKQHPSWTDVDPGFAGFDGNLNQRLK